MTPSQALPAVLQQIDAGLDQSLERLFEFLRIQSISTDPAYSKECQTAAAYVAKDLSGIGFKTSIRPTEGHPIVVGKGSPRANGEAPRVTASPPTTEAGHGVSEFAGTPQPPSPASRDVKHRSVH